jgi:hypothetical protein
MPIALFILSYFLTLDSFIFLRRYRMLIAFNIQTLHFGNN